MDYLQVSIADCTDIVHSNTQSSEKSVCRCAPPGALIASWQTAGFAESRPARMRETIQVPLCHRLLRCILTCYDLSISDRT